MYLVLAFSFFTLFISNDCLKIIDLGKEKWIVQNENNSIQIPAKVPGGIYSDLSNSKIIDEYIFGKGNDLKYRWVGNMNWTYSSNFSINKNDLIFNDIKITFFGLDTIAEIILNNKTIGNCNNMFTRYSFDIKNIIKEGHNELKIKFLSPIKEAKKLSEKISYPIVPECWPSSYHGECHINQLRKMQASFAWDWGPAFPSVGIWKPVHIELSEGKILRSVGTFVTPEFDKWRLTVRSWFEGDKTVTGDIFVNLTISPGHSYTICKKNVTVEEEEKVALLIPQKDVELWWPNGQGKQTLYKLKVQFTPVKGKTMTKSIKVAFRTIELIQESVSEDWSLGHKFYFKINGVPTFMKGSNWIPSHILPEELENRERITFLLQSSADANFNMLRVWGGGIYESEFFYNTCDQLGILVWQDLMFACSMYPATKEFLSDVSVEVEQNLKRLQHHPSIAIIAGNNENEAALRQNWYGTASNFKQYKDDYIQLYVNTIEPIVKRIHPQLTYLTSSPSNGVETIMENFVAKNPQSNLHGDIHYYNDVGNLWTPDIFPRPRFSSEYGTQSLPSLKTLRKAFKNEKDLQWNSNALDQRQHKPLGNDFLKLQMDLNLPLASNISDIVYLSQIHQAMAMKTETEHYRRMSSKMYSTGEGLTMGALFWQLNSIWEAPSWSSIDFHGNWKMLHYYARDFFSNFILSPSSTVDNELTIDVVSDLPYGVNCLIHIQVFNWTSFEAENFFEIPVKVNARESVQAVKDNLVKVLGSHSAFYDKLLVFKTETTPLISVPENYLFPVPLKESNFQDATVTIESIYKTSEYSAEITLKTDKIALFVWLETFDEKLDLHFSRNGFHMVEPTTTVHVYSKGIPIGDGPLLGLVYVRNLKPVYY